MSLQTDLELSADEVFRVFFKYSFGVQMIYLVQVMSTPPNHISNTVANPRMLFKIVYQSNKRSLSGYFFQKCPEKKRQTNLPSNHYGTWEILYKNRSFYCSCKKHGKYPRNLFTTNN